MPPLTLISLIENLRIVLPFENSKGLNDRIKQLKPDIKVLFMSGYTANVIVHRGVLEDNVDFLQKPFTVNAIAAKVREVLDR
jgi:FixJ family two-component response regulator